VVLFMYGCVRVFFDVLLGESVVRLVLVCL